MIEKQIQIINDICRALFSTAEEVDSLRYIYKFNPEEEWVGTRLLTIVGGEKKPIYLNDHLKINIEELCQELHFLMKSHTGGDWRKFILTLDENGEAKTQFIYEVQSCMDEFDED